MHKSLEFVRETVLKKAKKDLEIYKKMFGNLPKVHLKQFGPKTNSPQILIAIGGFMQEDAE